MSWADYFPTGEKARQYDGLINDTGIPGFSTTFDALERNRVPDFLIDAGSSKTKIERNKLSPNDCETYEGLGPNEIKFSSLQNLTDEEVGRLVKTKTTLVGDCIIPLIATAGIRTVLQDPEVNTLKRLQTILARLEAADILCVVASGELEAALEQNACRSIFENTARQPSRHKSFKKLGDDDSVVCSFSMGGQSTQYSNGQQHYSYDNMGAIAIKRMCCECKETCTQKKRVCTALQRALRKAVKHLHITHPTSAAVLVKKFIRNVAGIARARRAHGDAVGERGTVAARRSSPLEP